MTPPRITARGPASARRSAPVRVEAEATIAALGSGAVAAVTGLAATWGGALPLWSDTSWSLGAIAAIVVVALGLAVASLVYWRSRHLPGHEWRLSTPSWKFSLDTAAVALVHAALAGILAVVAFVILQRSFTGFEVDAFTAMVCLAVATGLAAYWIAISCATITTVRMAGLLVVFIATAVFVVMLSTSETGWWHYHFSALGSLGGLPSALFNVSLMIAGALVTVFAVYLDRDLTLLHASGLLRSARTPRTVMVLFIVMGVLLAGVGAIPVALSEPLHIASASGMFVAFLGMLVASPWLFAGLPRSMQYVTWAFLAALALATLLYVPIGYFNLTALELVAFTLIFGWIVTFIRFVTAALEAAESRAA